MLVPLRRGLPVLAVLARGRLELRPHHQHPRPHPVLPAHGHLRPRPGPPGPELDQRPYRHHPHRVLPPARGRRGGLRPHGHRGRGAPGRPAPAGEAGAGGGDVSGRGVRVCDRGGVHGAGVLRAGAGGGRGGGRDVDGAGCGAVGDRGVPGLLLCWPLHPGHLDLRPGHPSRRHDPVPVVRPRGHHPRHRHLHPHRHPVRPHAGVPGEPTTQDRVRPGLLRRRPRRVLHRRRRGARRGRPDKHHPHRGDPRGMGGDDQLGQHAVRFVRRVPLRYRGAGGGAGVLVLPDRGGGRAAVRNVRVAADPVGDGGGAAGGGAEVPGGLSQLGDGVLRWAAAVAAGRAGTHSAREGGWPHHLHRVAAGLRPHGGLRGPGGGRDHQLQGHGDGGGVHCAGRGYDGDVERQLPHLRLRRHQRPVLVQHPGLQRRHPEPRPPVQPQRLHRPHRHPSSDHPRRRRPHLGVRPGPRCGGGDRGRAGLDPGSDRACAGRVPVWGSACGGGDGGGDGGAAAGGAVCEPGGGE
mmetsp:Transcript_56790/g.151525  ORF Transcript_56790/g.151525 Transcript_56790/m.151525 type:complete len:519 (+) Transcript_56790:2271-3827(+)